MSYTVEELEVGLRQTVEQLAELEARVIPAGKVGKLLESQRREMVQDLRDREDKLRVRIDNLKRVGHS